MAVRSHFNPTTKLGCRITTVDPATRRIEAVLKDGGIVQIATYDAPQAFVWPQVDELWTIYRDGTSWRLGSRIETAEDAHSISDVPAGAGKIDANVIVDRQGRKLVALDSTGIADGDTLAWDAALQEWTVVPPPTHSGGTGTGDLSYIHVENLALSTWTVSHNLGKFPAVSVVDTAGTELYGDVHYVDANRLTITFSGATSGKAYLN